MSIRRILISLAVFVVLAGAVFYFSSVPQMENIPEVQSITDLQTRKDAPKDISVPEESSTNVPQNVAVPEMVVAAGPDTSYRLRIFDLAFNNGQFEPSTIIVRRGDRVQLNFGSASRAYSFTQPDYGIDWQIPSAGRSLSFGAQLGGQFTFYCSSCGGPGKGPLGRIIVAE